MTTHAVVRWTNAIALSIGLAVTARESPAQTTAPKDSASKPSVLIGIVKDSLGAPIPFAQVFAENGPVTATNDSGIFRLPEISKGLTLFGVRRLGYSPLTFSVTMPPDTTISVAIRLHQTVARLTEVTVEEKRRSSSLARSGFYERQNNAVGTFFTFADIAYRAPTRFEQILEGVLGVEVLTQNGHLIPVGRSPGGGRCRLSIFLDGHVFRLSGNEELPVPPNEIAAVEVYQRSAIVPVQFQDFSNPSCGSIVVWTRVD